MEGSSKSSGHSLVQLASIVTLLISTIACHEAPKALNTARAEVPDGSELPSVQQLIIKDRFPAYRHVQDPTIDQLAFVIDTLYRRHRTDQLAALSSRTLALFKEPMSDIDDESRRTFGIALMMVNGAVLVEDGVASSVGYLSKILAQWEARWPPPDSLGMELLTMKAKALHSQGEDVPAAQMYLEAARQALSAENWSRAGAHWRATAYIHLDKGALDSARFYFRKAIDLHSAPLSLDTNALAGAILASIAADRDSIIGRLELVKLMLPSVRDPSIIGFYYSLLGQYLAESGRTSAGTTCFKQAIRAVDTVRMKTQIQATNLAIYLHNAAYAHKNIGELEQAQFYGTQSVALNEALMRADDPIAARDASDRLAGNLEGLLLPDSTEARYGAGAERQMSVLRLRLARRPVDSVLVAKTYCNIAANYFYWDAAGVDSVFKYASLSLKWPSGAETAKALQLKAYALAQRGESDEALLVLRDAFSHVLGDPGFSWDEMERSEPQARINVITAMGTIEEVLEILERQDAAIKKLDLLQRMSHKQAAIIDSLFLIEGIDLSKLIKSRELMTERLLRSQWPSEPQYLDLRQADRVFALMDDDKAMTFRRDRFLMDQANGQVLRRTLLERREAREALLARGRATTDPEVLRWASEVDSLEALVAELPVSGELPTRTSDELAGQMRGVLQRDEALLEFRVTEDDVFLALVSKDSITFDRFSRTPAFNNAISHLTQAGAHIDSLSALSKEELLELRRLLPAEIANRRYRELVIVPSQELSYIPFEALPVNNIGKAPALIPLVDMMSLRYALSASMLLQEQDNRPVSRTEEVFAFAPDYGSGTSHATGTSARRSANVLLDSALRYSASPLLHNRDEAEAIGSIATGQTFIGSEFMESDLQNTLEEGGVLHLAMHAFSSVDPMRSGLVFSEVRDPMNMRGSGASTSNAEDGIFYGYELLTRRINASLVVLSACETGYGAHQDGEGVRSLARSFMLAGARSAVSSLWKVDDRATKEIMVKFYEHLAEGMGKADALAEAKRWYRKEYPNEPPSKWAAFILIGDNEPVRLKKRSPVQPWMMWMAAGGLAMFVGISLLNRRLNRAA